MRNEVIASIRQNYGGIWFNAGATIRTKTQHDAEDLVALNMGTWPKAVPAIAPTQQPVTIDAVATHEARATSETPSDAPAEAIGRDLTPKGQRDRKRDKRNGGYDRRDLAAK